jgi:EmrB/QacA subfamily drug resistance transporter
MAIHKSSDNNQKKWQLFLVVAVGVFMSTLDSSMVNIALPSIMDEYHSSLATTEWVVMIYLLTITVSLLFWGHLADHLGRGRIYSAGMLVFGVGSFFCGIANQIYLLIFFRFCQAIGASMMMSSGPAIIKLTFPASRLGRHMGLIGIAVSLGLMTGPTLGGFLIEFFSWRAVFFVTVPIGLIFFLFALFTMPHLVKTASIERFDWLGGLLWAASLSMAILAVTSKPPWQFVLLILAGYGFFLFIRNEKRTPNPILPISLIKRRFFSMAILSATLSFIVLFSVILLMPFFLDRLLVLSPLRIGLVMMALPISVLVISPIAGWLSDTYGAQYLSTIGLLVSTGSVLLLTLMPPDTSPFSVAVRLALLGSGQAMFLAPNSASVMAHIHDDYAGISAGLLATARNMGMLIGVGLAGLIFSQVFSVHTGGLDLKDFQPSHNLYFMSALRASFSAAVVIGLLAVVVSWRRGPKRQLENTNSG